MARDDSDLKRDRVFSMKLTAEMAEALEKISYERDTSKSELVREAVTEYLVTPSEPREGSFTHAARDLMGSVEGPEDLSHGRQHLEGYGS